ncbi:hypothetical protein PMNALOAF_3848 [Methylobacterium adhaesivum]|uniref:Uncharacterized protein n=1 Tax=Methylobacterium adhaesivum TaxID=333297 RepID=A0ABT8BJ29_9HYPH|nr:hypothetical protein [Methylobacterium adhaesivum]MDN3592173.1 hypothetical protein [Methylobacterium adhaesivum]GJD32572.1 hypothetical protein PMNALOAF_3848 [Methylobacterium adhaesivum]
MLHSGLAAIPIPNPLPALDPLTALAPAGTLAARISDLPDPDHFAEALRVYIATLPTSTTHDFSCKPAL